MTPRKTVPLPGSERTPHLGAKIKGPISGDEPIEVRITLKAPASLQQKAEDLASQPVAARQYVSREDFDKNYSSDQAAIDNIEQFASEHHLAVSGIDRAHHTVHLTGSARDMSLAFQTYLECYEQPDGITYRGRTGALSIPEELAGSIVSIDGLDDRPVAKPKLRMRPDALPHAAQSVSYTPQDLAKLYSFPSVANAGHGQCVGIVELGGGYRQTDLNAYFGSKGPKVTAVSVDRGRNAPTGNANGPDAEVDLDIEVVGAVAPGCSIAVYFAPNTVKGFLDAISAAVHDKTRKPSAVSISWGSPEDGGGYSASALAAFDQVFQAAAVLGVTVTVAAGDNGSSDGMSSGDHVDFPAADPWVLACGGTSLHAPNKTSIQSETVWNDGAQGGATGGGVSVKFPVPSYQNGLKAARTAGGSNTLTGRGVPDVAADADPVTGYQVLVDGSRFVIGGTSAVAPLMAGLVAILNQQTGKPVGFLNPTLYAAVGSQAVRDITSGNNGTFAAAQGWDACTGVGVPVGTAVLGLVKAQVGKAGA